MGFLSNIFSNPLNPIKSGFEALADLPGSPESAMNAGWDGITGEASWNPWDEGASVMDEGFLGDHGAESRRNRAAGRAVGTAIGTYFTGGALAPYLGATGGAAAAGGLAGGAQAAGTGENIGKGVLRGGAYAGLASGLAQGTSSALSGYTDAPASYLDEFAGSTPGGTTGGYLTPAQNAAISRGVSNVGTTAARGGDVRQAGLSSLLGVGGSFASPYFSEMGDSMGLGRLFGGGGMEDRYDGSGGMSTGPGVGRFSDPALGYSGGAQQGGMSQVPQVSQTSPFTLSNMDTSGIGTNYAQQSKGQSPMGDLGTGTYGGDFSFDTMTPTQPSADFGGQPADGGNWQENLKKFMGGQGGQAALRALGALDPKTGDMVRQLLGQQQGQRMGGLEALVGAGATLYARNRADRSLGQQARQLQDLFSPNSAYAQQMQQKLARQDAAAGRRSQGGTREVELQARLAELNSRNAPQLAQLNGAQDMNRMRMLSELMGYGQRSGAFDYAREGIGSLFKG